MAALHIITDTACDLPVKFLQEKGISVVPMTINFPDHSYRDGIDITPGEFYRLYASSVKIPSTAQPTPGAVFEVLREVIERGDEALMITISTGMSGTYENACIARKEFAKKDRIAIFDSKKASMGQGLLVMEAFEMAQAGLDLKETVRRLERIRDRMYSVFTLQTLEYLQKGGRVGKMQAVAGDVLNIKVILEINEEGYIVQREKARGRRRAIERILEIMEKEGKDLSAQRIGVSHSQSEEEAAAIANEIKERLGVKSVLFGEITATVGTHVGPGCLAFFFQT